MIDSDFLARFRHLIPRVEGVEHTSRRGIEVFRARLNLSDGTNLRVSEVRMDGQVEKYSYYWLDEHDTLLIGWDNTAHHPQVDTFPHHRHKPGTIEASHEQDLESVLSYISESIGRRYRSI